MPELRQNYFTKEWVIIATERARRPEELATHRAEKPGVRYLESCPFCPGNESKTPPEILRVAREGSGAWHIRAVANKFAALSPDTKPTRSIQRSRRSMGGFGMHEVIIDTPGHSDCTALMSESHVADLLKVYKARHDLLTQDHRIAQVIIFKNHGTDAGASLAHPHSQIIATPVISQQVRDRFKQALSHYDEFGECMFCQMLEEEIAERSRIVLASKHLVALEMFASPTPFCTHLYPRRHMASFGDITPDEIADLAGSLRNVLRRLHFGLQNPDFNYTIRTAPAKAFGVKHFHWYVSIIPRLTRVAGFELGSGMFINTVLPEAAAEFLRGVELPSVADAASAG